MGNKVKLVVYDANLKGQVGNYEVSDSGDKIKVVSGGEGHFMPSFDNDSYLELPKKFLGRTIGYEKVYFAPKRSKACVNFKAPKAEAPDPEEIDRAIGSLVLEKMGQDKPAFPPILIYVIVAIQILIAANLFGVIG